jgi:hypothetical protein
MLKGATLRSASIAGLKLFACFPQARLEWLSPTILSRQRRVQEFAVEVDIHHDQPITLVPTDHKRLLERRITVLAEVAYEVGAG